MITEGRKRFAAAVLQISTAEMIQAIKVTRQHVSQLASGERRPSLDLAIIIEREIGIPCREWAKR
jgi:plasmid maintenance system antidote protein VapI